MPRGLPCAPSCRAFPPEWPKLSDLVLETFQRGLFAPLPHWPPQAPTRAAPTRATPCTLQRAWLPQHCSLCPHRALTLSLCPTFWGDAELASIRTRGAPSPRGA